MKEVYVIFKYEDTYGYTKNRVYRLCNNKQIYIEKAVDSFKDINMYKLYSTGYYNRRCKIWFKTEHDVKNQQFTLYYTDSYMFGLFAWLSKKLFPYKVLISYELKDEYTKGYNEPIHYIN